MEALRPMYSALGFYGLQHDIDAVSDAQYYVCWLVRHPRFPREGSTQDRENYTYICVKRMLLRFLSRRTEYRKRYVTASQHTGEGTGRDRKIERLAESPDTPTAIQRERDAEAALREWEEWRRLYTPGNYSRKQYLINRIRRERINGNNPDSRRRGAKRR